MPRFNMDLLNITDVRVVKMDVVFGRRARDRLVDEQAAKLNLKHRRV